MKILVTGSEGFIGKNLIADLKFTTDHTILAFNRETSEALLDEYCQQAEFVFHLAGVNRPETEEEFMTGNFGFTSTLLETLKKYANKSPIMISSSTQAELDNPYGKSKRAGEDLLRAYSEETCAPVMMYRFPNVFGKWTRPNYNSAIATFCHNVARNLPIQVNNRDAVLNLVYIDDVVAELKQALKGQSNRIADYCAVPTVHQVSLGRIVDLIHTFRESRSALAIPDMNDAFTKKLYSTYLSYLPEEAFSYELKMNKDNRGSFTEFIRTKDRGQVSVNISKPGIVKGNHWHHTKNEKFLVVSGEGVIRFRKLDSEEVISYPVSGEKLEVVDIPVGYTHNIENTGKDEMVTVMWVNEPFNPDAPDTYFLEV